MDGPRRARVCSGDRAGGAGPPKGCRGTQGETMDSTDQPDDSMPPAPTEPGNRFPDGLRDVLLFVPRFAALLGRLIADPEVASTDKLLVGAVIAYILSPLDIIPDMIPVLGQLDDAYLVALCLLRLLNRSGEAKVRQYWDGPEDIVQILHTVSDYATRYLPAAVRNAIRGWVDVRDASVPPSGTASSDVPPSELPPSGPPPSGSA